jgi:hypothetical protein
MNSAMMPMMSAAICHENRARKKTKCQTPMTMVAAKRARRVETETDSRRRVADDAAIRIVDAMRVATPHECRQCARRFTTVSLLDAHMDTHFAQRRRWAGAAPRSRAWSMPAADWTCYSECGGGGGIDEVPVAVRFGEGFQSPQPPALPPRGVAIDDSGNAPDPQCAFCSDRFEIRFDRIEDEWFACGAIRENGILAHERCARARASLF